MVNSKISKSELGSTFDTLFFVYDNVLLLDNYESDSITFSTKNQERRMPFKSFFLKKNDTISIDGAYGLFGGFGFSLKIVNEEPILYHMLSGDDFPIYSRTKDGKLHFRIEVPCTETEIILSKIPDAIENEVIYGMVKFKSDIYYSASSVNGDIEPDNLQENQVGMTIYFKSRYFDFEDFRKDVSSNDNKTNTIYDK
ncbi:hypothetical protein [Winogradskyella flava]|uniref:Uncharacterized protein n=1 Tax=Winogradskyella flava TaxID=1884876 RepID=A0A842INW2_9FLAO|nr:hypothetical protein [Winogradskyella flava]MBC2843586.1 hypothetical protein [Winogradskyella flava]